MRERGVCVSVVYARDLPKVFPYRVLPLQQYCQEKFLSLQVFRRRLRYHRPKFERRCQSLQRLHQDFVH